MKIAVIAANGKAGKLIVKDAKQRGMEVTAFVRHENQTVADNVVNKDIFELEKDDLKNFDVIVDAIGGWTPETFHVVPDAVKYLAGLLSGTKTRLLVVGGAGSLFVNNEHTKTVADGLDLPASVQGVLDAHQQALDELRTYDNVNWTYISPAMNFEADGEETGNYILGGDEYMTDNEGNSSISYADYAIAMVDEIEAGRHIKQRISVIGK